jgi:glycosyltransferase involved in cell wall biosynthesis
VEWDLIPLERTIARKARDAVSVAAGRPYSATAYASDAMADRLREASAVEPGAWVIAHSYHLGSLANRSGLPSWVDMHNVDSEIWAGMARTSRSLPRRIFARWQVGAVHRLETAVVAGATGISVVSERDRVFFASVSSAIDPVVISNGVDTTRYRFRDGPAPGDGLVFIGDLRWEPNADGVRWFARHVWPALRSHLPDVRVEVVGRLPPDDIRALADDRFIVVGDVPDTRPHLARAALAIVPLLVGGGTRLKILEAAAAGVPVVSTSVGASGLDLRPGSEIEVVDTPAAWIKTVADLVRDPARRSRMAAAARASVEDRYDWSSIGRDFVDALARAEAAGRP